MANGYFHKNQLLIAFCLFNCVSTRRTSGDMLWSYWGRRGEKSWNQDFNKCKGRMQSPININTNELVKDATMQIDYINYDLELTNAILLNSGHGVKIIPDENATSALITGSALNNQTYKFLELHFHWNDGPHNGSEHAIDGVKYAMESHFVHRNVKYDNTESANQHDDGFSIISLLFIEVEQPNQMYDSITEHLHNVQDIGQRYIFETPIILKSLFPPNNDIFYRYFGSYTTPTCQESVTWIIYPEPVFIDVKQIKKFRILYTAQVDEKTGRLKRMLGNIRHLQEVGNRVVHTSGISSMKKINDLMIIFCVFFINYSYSFH